jgi:glycosyltransferase involved in cell wall biosynthesis
MRINLGKPKVSVVVPAYNSERTLSECLKSIHEQSYPHHETIVIDNFSDDGTIGISKRFGARVIQRKCNPASARNIGIANSTGKYVLFLDSDQILSTRVIEECVDKCTVENVGMVRIPEVFIGKGFWGSCSAIWKNYYEKIEQLRSTSGGVIHGEPRFFNKEKITRLGMLDGRMVFGEDYLLYEKMRKANVKEAYCKSKVYHYELASIEEILLKDLRYGRSMPIFLKQTEKPILSLMLRHAILTFRELIKDMRSLTMLVGCAVLVWLKTCTIVIGLISRTDRSGGKKDEK